MGAGGGGGGWWWLLVLLLVLVVGEREKQGGSFFLCVHGHRSVASCSCAKPLVSLPAHFCPLSTLLVQ
jgi:hypothetical protein